MSSPVANDDGSATDATGEVLRSADADPGQDRAAENEDRVGSSVRHCVIVGRGRAGSSFAAALDGRGWSVDVLGARSVMASEPAAAVIDLLDSADVVLLAVPDDAIAALSRRLATVADVRAIVAHVSGASDLDVLRPHGRRASVHPLVSLPDPGIGAQRLLDRCDFAIDGDPDIEAIVDCLGGRAFVVSAERRAAYHAAASVAANHLTALCAQVEAIARVAEVPVDAYWRLMSTTLENVADVGPTAALTGPSARGDWDTVRRHLAAIPAGERATYRALGERVAVLAGRTWPRDLEISVGDADRPEQLPS